MENLPPIRYGVKYIAELFQQINDHPFLATANIDFSRAYNIYHFSIAEPITDESNYWIEWGGSFDNYSHYGIQVFLNLFLLEVSTTSDLLVTDNSFYIDQDNDICYINIPRKPWQYYLGVSGLYSNKNSTFATAPRDPANLSDIYYGGVKASPRLDVPDFENEINDVISGIVSYSDFSVNIFNDDGEYDDLEIIDYFNTPMQIGKVANEEADSIEDFNTIRKGIIGDIDVAFDKLSVKAYDKIFLLNKTFCRKFITTNYAGLSDSDNNSDMPVAWGSVKYVKLFEINRASGDPCAWIEYLALDPDYITAASTVYDSDGNSLTFSFTAATGVIRVTERVMEWVLIEDGEPDEGEWIEGECIEGETADVTGKADNSLGQIILEALENENFEYVSGFFDTDEVDDYLDICPDVNFYFDGGTTRDLLEALLKSDNVFLILKNNGLITIRRWDVDYDIFYVPEWLITRKPSKNFEGSFKNFCSSARVLYNKNNDKDEYLNNYLDDSQEKTIYGNYKRSYEAEFETDLSSENEAIDLAGRLLDRFGSARELLEISLGVDTFQINPLDKIYITPIINDREFSEYGKWIVTSVNPGQDKLKLESLSKIGRLTFDDENASIDSYNLIVDNV